MNIAFFFLFLSHFLSFLFLTSVLLWFAIHIRSNMNEWKVNHLMGDILLQTIHNMTKALQDIYLETAHVFH